MGTRWNSGAASRPRTCARPDTARVLEPAPSELGRVTKAHLLRWLHVERPAVARVEVRLPAAGTGGIRVNEQLGFVTTGELVTVSRSC